MKYNEIIATILTKKNVNFQLFILHVEYLLTASESALGSPKSDHGCTDIMINNMNEVRKNTQ